MVRCDFGSKQTFPIDDMDFIFTILEVRDADGQNLNAINGSAMTVLLGDLDNDNDIDTSDFRILYLYVNGTSDTLTDYQVFASDVNRDGIINAMDSLTIMYYINGNIYSFI